MWTCVNSNMLPSQSVNSLNASRYAHAPYLTFWSCFSGVFEQEGGHVGWAVEENRASSAVFFRKPTYIKTGFICLWIEKKGVWTGNSRQSMTVHRMQREDRRTLQRLCLNWSKFGRSRSFFPPLLLLSCQILLSFSAGAWHRYGNGPGLTFPQTVFLKWTLHFNFNCLCLDVPTFKPLSSVASCGGWLICRRIYLLPQKLFATKTGKNIFRLWKCGFCIFNATLNVSSSVKARGGRCIFFEVRCKVHTKKGTFG